jgi:hypothetical protein
MSKREVERLFKQVPALAEAWDNYGFAFKREEIVDCKSVISPGYHLYAAFLLPDGSVADLAGSSMSGWEVQNDSSEPVTPAQFKKLRIPDGCDWLEGWPDDEDSTED